MKGLTEFSTGIATRDICYKINSQNPVCPDQGTGGMLSAASGNSITLDLKQHKKQLTDEIKGGEAFITNRKSVADYTLSVPI